MLTWCAPEPDSLTWMEPLTVRLPPPLALPKTPKVAHSPPTLATIEPPIVTLGVPAEIDTLATPVDCPLILMLPVTARPLTANVSDPVPRLIVRLATLAMGIDCVVPTLLP